MTDTLECSQLISRLCWVSRPPHDQEVQRETAIARSLIGIADGSVAALGDLYDVIGLEVWEFCLLITGDPRAADRATITTFRRAWRTSDAMPREPSAALKWLLATAHEITRQNSTEDTSCRGAAREALTG